jgi:hypothetical protein
MQSVMKIIKLKLETSLKSQAIRAEDYKIEIGDQS